MFNHTLTLFSLIITALFCGGSAMAQVDLSGEDWANICSGKSKKVNAEWYGSSQAQQIADIVLSVQKTNGGWMKNDQLHKLSATELSALQGKRSEHSCLDNYATTQEMRFLAKVYQATKVEKYRTAFQKALQMIFAAEFEKGGWGQYWPLTDDKWSYQNYITFNDDLMINVMKMLRDVKEAKGDFAGLADPTTRKQCAVVFDRSLQLIIDCQVDDNGVKAAWCAQHDPVDHLPTEGRPHELPSISGYESANLLLFLMTIDNPSPELQECITSAIEWLDNHKYMEGKAIEDFTNANGEADRRIVDRAGSNIWGRFIQIGGQSGKLVFDKLVKKLKDRNKKRTYETGGKSYTYYEYEIAQASYRTDKAYQPIYSIYDDKLQHLYYRYLYNYDDTPNVTDSKGCSVATSLNAYRRTHYQYLGSWCQKAIQAYPEWKARVLQQSQTPTLTYELSANTYTTSISTTTYSFSDGFSISNSSSKAYAAGLSSTIKYSANVNYTVNIPEGLQVVKVTFTGYDNYDADAYLSSLNGVSYSSADYVFAAKTGDNPVWVDHNITLANPATGSMTFRLGSKQCCLILTLHCKAADADDVNLDGAVNVADIEAHIHALGTSPSANDEKIRSLKERILTGE